MKRNYFRSFTAPIATAACLFAHSAMAGVINVDGYIVDSQLGNYLAIEGTPVQLSDTFTYVPGSSIYWQTIDSNHFTFGETLFDRATSGTVVVDAGNGSSASFDLGQNLSQNNINGTFTYGTYGTYLFSETVKVNTAHTQIDYSNCIGLAPYWGDCTSSPQIVQNDIVGQTERTFYFTVEVGDVAPTITGITDSILAYQGSIFSYGVTATDFEPLTYSWDLNGDGVFGDALGANGSYSFGTPGTHPLLVMISDGAKTVERGIIVNVIPTSPVPEPQTYVMLLTGLGLIGYTRRRKNNTA